MRSAALAMQCKRRYKTVELMVEEVDCVRMHGGRDAWGTLHGYSGASLILSTHVPPLVSNLRKVG